MDAHLAALDRIAVALEAQAITMQATDFASDELTRVMADSVEQIRGIAKKWQKQIETLDARIRALEEAQLPKAPRVH